MNTGRNLLIKILVAGLLDAGQLMVADARADGFIAMSPVRSVAVDTHQDSENTNFTIMSPPAAQTAVFI